MIVESSDIIESLTCKVEEADDRIVVHCAWEINQGSTQLLVMSNDTDTVTRLLYFLPEFQKRGLQELWVEFGIGERKRYLPLHILAIKLGPDLCRVVVKTHVLTGDDALSKIGTKYASLLCDPQNLLATFGESSQLSNDEIVRAEKYLVNVWTGLRSKFKFETFNKLRVHYVINSTPKPLQNLPPTSCVIHGHIYRAYYVIKKIINLLNDPNLYLDPLSHCWINDNGMLIPEKCINPLPYEYSVICKCTGNCKTKTCVCKRNIKNCVVFCHKKSMSKCTN